MKRLTIFIFVLVFSTLIACEKEENESDKYPYNIFGTLNGKNWKAVGEIRRDTGNVLKRVDFEFARNLDNGQSLISNLNARGIIEPYILGSKIYFPSYRDASNPETIHSFAGIYFSTGLDSRTPGYSTKKNSPIVSYLQIDSINADTTYGIGKFELYVEVDTADFGKIPEISIYHIKANFNVPICWYNGYDRKCEAYTFSYMFDHYFN